MITPKQTFIKLKTPLQITYLTPQHLISYYLTLSHFKFHYLKILKHNTKISTNFHLNLFIFYLLIKHITIIHTYHS